MRLRATGIKKAFLPYLAKRATKGALGFIAAEKNAPGKAFLFRRRGGETKKPPPTQGSRGRGKERRSATPGQLPSRAKGSTSGRKRGVHLSAIRILSEKKSY